MRSAALLPGTRPRWRIGISGWRYARWRGVFYPADLPQRRELEFAARTFDSIEINGSFYSLQDAASWQRWYEQAPADFVYAVKCPRFISHMKRLNDIEAPLANFFASGVLLLREKLGPLLWQFPRAPAFRRGKMARFPASAAQDRRAGRKARATARPSRSPRCIAAANRAAAFALRGRTAA